MADSPLLDLLEADRTVIDFVVTTPPPPPRPEIKELLAGAAEVDITPPPGMPKAGHSRNAQDGIGFRTRLRARVLHLRSGSASLAIVACDLHAGSAVVHRLVAQAIRDQTDVPPPGLLLGATHTHAGPGQFHGCDFYNRFASNRPGFDPAYSQFLVKRISAAVVEAVSTRKPARLAAGSTEVWGFTRNRSLAAHVINDTVTDKRTGAQRKYAAVNPWLHLLRVDAAAPDGGHEPLAAMAVFSIHGTGISRHDPSYNADVWAYITGELSHRVQQRTGTRAVVGAIEGSHGDMTPAVRPGLLVYPEAERVGRGIGEAAADLHDRLEASLTDDVRLAAGLREIDLSARPRPVVAGISLPGPAIGTAKLAGAVENSTPLLDRIPPFKPGYPKPRVLSGRAQGAKWVFGSPLVQRLVTPPATLPHVLPLQLLVIGPMAIVGLPFEVTAEAGQRLESALERSLRERTAVERTVVSSVANDYWDYLTTPEEYTLQCYEGASNLYGPRAHAFVTAACADLADDLLSSPGGMLWDGVADRRFRFHARRYLPRRATTWGIARRVRDTGFHEATPTEDAFWEFRWSDGPPAGLDWHEPLVRVEAEVGADWVPAAEADGRCVDDQGWHVGVVHLGDQIYAARWYGPPLGRPGRHRFVLEANAGRPEVPGDPFD